MSKSISRVPFQNSLDDKDFIIQITKAQLIKFLQFIGVIAIVALNILAVKISSAFLKELLFSQLIIAFLFISKKLN
jgi:hypothetical protein